MYQGYLPEWEDQIRGYSILGSSVFSWQDIKEARAFDLINRKLFASRAFIQYNPSGEADGGTVFSDPDASRADENNNQTGLHSEVVDGVTINYMKANSGSRIEAVEDKRPTQEQQKFEETIIRSELHAIGWSYDFSYNSSAVGGAMGRVIVARINRRASSLRDRLVIPWRKRFDQYRIAKAIKNGDLPANDEWYMWGYNGHTPITADAKYDADVDISVLRAGLTTRQQVATKRNQDWREIDTKNEAAADNVLQSADRLSKKWNITLQAALVMLREMNNGNSSPQFEQPPADPQIEP